MPPIFSPLFLLLCFSSNNALPLASVEDGARWKMVPGFQELFLVVNENSSKYSVLFSFEQEFISKKTDRHSFQNSGSVAEGFDRHSASTIMEALPIKSIIYKS